jgi:Protein of unknown function (DUF2750)
MTAMTTDKRRSVTMGFDQIRSRDARTLTRRKIDAVEVYNIATMSESDRVTYFLQEVLAQEEVWSAWEDRGLLCFKLQGNTYTPFWPHEQYSLLSTEREFPSARYVPIPLDDWIDKILMELKKRDELIRMFPDKYGAGKDFKVEEVLSMLTKERDAPSPSPVSYHIAGDMAARPKGDIPT